MSGTDDTSRLIILRSEHSVFVGERYERSGFLTEIWEHGNGPDAKKIRAAYVSLERLVDLKKQYEQLTDYDKTTKAYGLKLDELVKEQWKFRYNGDEGFLVQLVERNGRYDLIPHKVKKCFDDKTSGEKARADFDDIVLRGIEDGRNEEMGEVEEEEKQEGEKTSDTDRLPESQSSKSSGVLGAYVPPDKAKLKRDTDKYGRKKPTLTEKKVTLAAAEEALRKGRNP